MPAFWEILTEAQLPEPGTRCEDHTFDLKGGHNPNKPLEWAKDIAAFANHFGGNIIVGVPEVAGAAGEWSPIRTSEEAAKVATDYSTGASLCHPPPARMNPQRIELKRGGFIMVINVWPSPSQLIGVPHETFEHYYRFPRRVGNITTHIHPENFAMHMDAHLRRVVILLSAIPKGAVVAIVHRSVDALQASGNYQGPLEVDEKTNTFTANPFNAGGPPQVRCLDEVETVFQWKPSHWAVVVPHRSPAPR